MTCTRYRFRKNKEIVDFIIEKTIKTHNFKAIIGPKDEGSDGPPYRQAGIGDQHNLSRQMWEQKTLAIGGNFSWGHTNDL